MHWKIVATWIKTKDLSQWMLISWHLHVELGTSGTKPLNNIDETFSMVFLFVCFPIINCHYKSDLPLDEQV